MMWTELKDLMFYHACPVHFQSGGIRKVTIGVICHQFFLRFIKIDNIVWSFKQFEMKKLKIKNDSHLKRKKKSISDPFLFMFFPLWCGFKNIYL